MDYTLRPSETGTDALRRVGGEVLDDALAQLRQSDPESLHGGVHEARKACKKLRALLRLYRGGLGPTFRKENAALRDAARVLAASRDRHVMAAVCGELLSHAETETETVAVRAALESLALQRHESPSSATVTEAATGLQSVRLRVSGWRVAHARRSAAAGAAETFRRAKKALALCTSQGESEPWHEWRKQVKHHWYHARLLGGLHPVAEPYAEVLNQLQTTLGDEHDLTIVLATLDRSGPIGTPQAEVAASIAKRRARDLRKKAQQIGRQVFRPSPRFVEELVHSLLRR